MAQATTDKIDPHASRDPWEECAKRLKEHDEEMVKSWKEEMDTLLVFAGLFSAVLTTFNVQSYQLLQTAPSADATVQLLAQISAQLSSFSVSTGFVNSTQASFAPATLASLQAQPVTAASVRINILWFISLIFSLSAASICMLVKQWISQYSNGLTGTSRDAARTRQFRNDCLKKWRVITIMTLLPMLLQAALVLFFAGMLELIWSLNSCVAAIATLFVVMLGAFLLTTTALPAFISDCSYQSPQALAFFVLLQMSIALMQRFCEWTWKLDGRYRFWHFVNQPRTYSWRDRERWVITKLEWTSTYDARMLVAADLVLADDSFLQTVVIPCLRSIGPAQAAKVFRAIVKNCSQQLVYRKGREIVMTRSIAALIHVAVDILAEMVVYGSAVELFLLRFLVKQFYSTALFLPLPLQRIHDVSAVILRDEDHERRRLACSIMCNASRSPGSEKITVTGDDLTAIITCIQWLLSKDKLYNRGGLSLRAMQMLMQYASSGAVSDVHLEILSFEVLALQQTFFGLWEAVPFTEHPMKSMMELTSCSVRLARRNPKLVDSNLLQTLIRINMAYEAHMLGVSNLARERCTILLQELEELRASSACSDWDVGQPALVPTSKTFSHGTLSMERTRIHISQN